MSWPLLYGFWASFGKVRLCAVLHKITYNFGEDLTQLCAKVGYNLPHEGGKKGKRRGRKGEDRGKMGKKRKTDEILILSLGACQGDPFSGFSNSLNILIKLSIN